MGNLQAEIREYEQLTKYIDKLYTLNRDQLDKIDPQERKRKYDRFHELRLRKTRREYGQLTKFIESYELEVVGSKAGSDGGVDLLVKDNSNGCSWDVLDYFNSISGKSHDRLIIEYVEVYHREDGNTIENIYFYTISHGIGAVSVLGPSSFRICGLSSDKINDEEYVAKALRKLKGFVLDDARKRARSLERDIRSKESNIENQRIVDLKAAEMKKNQNVAVSKLKKFKGFKV